MKWLRRTLFAAGVAAGAYASLAAVMAGGLTRSRRVRPEDTPATVGLPYETVRFESRQSGTELSGWLVPAPAVVGMGQATDQRWVVLVHGFGANRGDPVSGLLGLARDLHSRGFGICLFDLRASGDSSGSRASAGYYERLDLLGALDYLSSRGVDRARIGVLGFSLGGAVALMTCAHPGTAGAVVADGAFADLWMMIRRSQQGTRRWLGVLNPGLAVMARILHGIDIGEVSPARSVAASDLPVLIIHGELDSHVPVKHAELLARAAGLQISGMEAGNDVLWIVPGAAHNQAYRSNPELYVDRVAAFFDRALAEQTPAVGPDSGRLT